MATFYVLRSSGDGNSITKCGTYEQATAYLHWAWENEYNEEIGQGEALNEEETYHEETYAQIETEHGWRTRYEVLEECVPEDAFEENWERYVP